MATPVHPVHGRIEGAAVIIGFGSIGKGTLPLIQRHFDYDADRLTVIDPDPATHTFLSQHKIRHLQTAITRDNYRVFYGETLEAVEAWLDGSPVRMIG